MIMITEFRKRTQVAFISYSLGPDYVAESIAQFPGCLVIKGDHGFQVWVGV